MKKLIILLFVLCSWQARSQYYQHTYGNTAAAVSAERNRQHIPSTASGSGYVMVGLSDLGTAFTTLSVNVIRTDDNGKVPGAAPYFNNAYVFSDPITGVVYNARATSVAELPNGGTPEYAVVGTVLVDPTVGPEVFYLRLDASGTVLLQRRYYLSGYIHRTTKMKTDAAGNTLYITGTCSAAGGGGTQDVFVFSIDAATTAVNWGKRYDVIETGTGNSLNDVGMDLIENPYTANELLVVGNASDQALILRLDATNGNAATTNPCMRYIIDAAHSNHVFTSIKTSANPLVTSNDAFIIGGNANNGGVTEVWTVLTDQLGNMGGWSTYHASSSGNSISCQEVIERQNTSGAYEYYTVGTINQSGTDDDVVVLKIDNTGNTVANGEFWYGTSSEIERGLSIVASNTGGFNVSGNYISGSGDEEQLQVNAYFSGETGCNYTISTPTSTAAGSLTDHSFNDFGSPLDDNFAVSVSSLTNNQICYATSVFGGSNARSAFTGPVLQFSIANNGRIAEGNNAIEVFTENPLQPDWQVQLMDVLGREIKTVCQAHTGNHLSISAGHLPRGLYYLNISSGGQRQAKTLLIR